MSFSIQKTMLLKLYFLVLIFSIPTFSLAGKVTPNGKIGDNNFVLIIGHYLDGCQLGQVGSSTYDKPLIGKSRTESTGACIAEVDGDELFDEVGACFINSIDTTVDRSQVRFFAQETLSNYDASKYKQRRFFEWSPNTNVTWLCFLRESKKKRVK